MKRINVDWIGKNQKKNEKRLEMYEEKLMKLRKEDKKDELRTVL